MDIQIGTSTTSAPTLLLPHKMGEERGGGKNVLKVFLLVSLILFSFGFTTGCTPKIDSQHPAVGANYQCSMHPSVVSSKPENCPICGMRLTQIDSLHMPLVSQGKGKLLFYRHPMRPEVTSPKPGKDEMGMDYIPVYENEETGTRSSVPGHAEIVISSERQQLIGVQTAVAEEKPLAVMVRVLGHVGYDHDLYNTLAEYKEALTMLKKVKGTASMEVRQRAESLLDLADKKVRLMGLSDEQMHELVRYNPNVQRIVLPEGESWVYADIYEYESDLIQPGQKVRLSAPVYPGVYFDGEIRSTDALLNMSSHTLRARIEVFPGKKVLKPGMSVDVEIEAMLGKKLAVPENAVFYTGETALIFVEKGGGHIEPRQVEVGRLARAVNAADMNDYYEILSGLSSGETVISSANFLIDSESRLRAAALGFSSPKSEVPVSSPVSGNEKKGAV